MRHPAHPAASPPRPQPHRPAQAPQHPRPGPPPPGQHPAAARALKLPARQLPLDHNRPSPYREHQRLRALHGPPGRTRPRDTGRACACPTGKVPPPTNSHAPGTSSQHHRRTQCRKTAAAVSTHSAAQHFAPPPPPFPPDAAEKREHEKAVRGNAERAAREVFGRRARPRAVTGTRDPHQDEATAARRLTRALREATAGESATVTVTSKVPPGRLRMGRALAGKAQRAAGAVPTAEPFTRTRSRRVPAPPLRVGIACDISGSMGAFAGPVASAAWILARAAGHLPSALTASVLFGKGVYALTRPGERPAQVTDFRATASTENACRAIDALDGALGLASPGTARLLVIVSDAMFVAHGEPAGVQQRITRLHRAGCGVIILPPRATPPSASTPTARSPRPPAPPAPSTPSPAPPPAPSPPDTRPGRAAQRGPPQTSPLFEEAGLSAATDG